MEHVERAQYVCWEDGWPVESFAFPLHVIISEENSRD